ncbi:uncharacterized protein LOC108022959 isoform X2 [Drosophila biarmipes]|nr:uncharacterized protein LOC108022959 isoform X2 [Drosophila biarmipes]
MLERSVVYNGYVRPICIYLDRSVGRQIRKYDAYGWGRTSNAPGSDVLKTVALDRRDPRVCTEKLGLTPRETQICAEGTTGDTCGGDSGGPLIGSLDVGGHTYEAQFGIISMGTSGCWGVGVYTDVAGYVDWIAKTITNYLGMWLYKDCAGYSLESILGATIYGANRTSGGVLITDRYVLTSAENLPNIPDFLSVVVMHLEFKVQGLWKSQNGIALLQLNHQVTIDGMKPICMFGTNYLRQPYQLGRFQILGSTDRGYKYYCEVDIVDNQMCANHVQRAIEPTQFCVADILRQNCSQTIVKPGDILSEKQIYFVLLGIVTYSYNGLHVIENARAYTELIEQTVYSNSHSKK